MAGAEESRAERPRKRRPKPLSETRAKAPHSVNPAPPRAEPLMLDRADEIIVDLLAQDGRSSNRSLAAATGLTEATIASRLRRLRELRVLHVTALLDRRMLGLTNEMDIAIRVRGRPLKEVAHDLAGLPQVTGASLLLGSFDVQAMTAAASLDEQAEVIRTISMIAGVDQLIASPILRWYKLLSSRASLRLSDDWLPDLRSSAIPLDQLDAAIIEQLISDARQSNREIARTLDASEATVRARLRRMEDTGLLRISGVVDRTRMGANRDIAFVAVDVDGDVELPAREISAWPEVAACYSTTGSARLRCLVVTSEPSQLADLVGERLRSVPGIRSTETSISIDAFAHRYNLSLFTDPPHDRNQQ